METITLGGGCFWCLEAVYDDMRGVVSVESGYMGGHVDNPSYEAVCMGSTGHAEVVRVTFDPDVVSYRQVLEIFFAMHDPTTLNRQGNDVGTQYRSAIFYESDEQKTIAEEVIREVAPLFDAPIVTELSPAEQFYIAEAYHQQYFAKNPYQPYCMFAVGPKLVKFRKKYTAMSKATGTR